uniref:Importin-4 n=1 Tax=Geotrypetes seraphini TaxID=260995 RepID=A0A6P8P863_GEOSA|nr:importin-4 [Geotrypetes seraphini]
MAGILESILTNLLQPDNAVIQQATAQLKEAFKDPAVLAMMCEVLTASSNPQIRQFAAVLVRRRLTKHWKQVNLELRENLKSLVLEAIQREPEHKVRHAVAQLAAIILKNETLQKWPQLLHFLQQASRSSVPEQRQVGLLLLSTVVEASPEAFQPHFRDLLRLFHQTLTDRGNKVVLHYSIQTVTVMVSYMGTDEMNLMRSLIPKIISAIRELIRLDEVQAIEAMEVFDEMMESEVSIIIQHLSEVVHFCLEIAANRELGDNLRVKALSCISFLIKLKSKAIVKQKLLAPILNTLFPIMSAEPPLGEMDPEDNEEQDSDMEEDAEVQTPKHFSVQVVDMLALHLPPEKLFPQLTLLMEPALLSMNPYQRKAGLMCLAVLSEGCADHIRHKHLQPMLQIVCQALGDENQVVRNAALFALGQFSENLQPDISNFSEEIMPLLLNYFSSLEPSHIGHLEKVYYALENFVENLGPKIQPYLPTLMERVLASLRESERNRIKELSVSTIGSIATAAESLLLPYFPAVIEHLKGYLVNTHEDFRPVQIQSLETLGLLARTLGKDVFLPLSEECCQLGLSLSDQVDDPDLRRCTYSLFGALSLMMGDSISSHLEKITTLMRLSLKSTEGVVTHYSENISFLLFDDDEAEEEEDSQIHDEEIEDDDPDIEGFTVENAYIDEKEDACVALGEIALNASGAFIPYLEPCFEEVFKHHESPHMNIRKAVYETLGQFCRALHKVCQNSPPQQNSAALQKMLDLVFPVYFKAIQEDKERLVVMSILEAMNDIIKDCKSTAMQDARRLGEICQVVRLVLQQKTCCQDPEAEDGDDDDGQQAEYDSMLIEYAGEGIPLIALAVGGQMFAPYFAGFLPLLLSKMKPNSSSSDKSFAVGTIAETVQALGPFSAQFLPRLLPVLLAGAREDNEEVRSNSVFGLGVVVEHGKEAAFEHYPKILGVLSSIIAQEENIRVKDNVCGAVSRLIMTSPERVPVDQVLPVMLKSMPLKDDFEENTTTFNCIAFLYKENPEQVVQHMKEIVRIFSHVLGTEEIKPETTATLLLLLKDVAQRFPQELQNAIMSLPADKATKINTALAAP